MPRNHIVAAAEIVKAINNKLNASSFQFSAETNREIDAYLDPIISHTLKSLDLCDHDTHVAVKNAVTCALYLRLEELLVELDREGIELKTKTP